MTLHFGFPSFPTGVLLWSSPLMSSWVKLSTRKFFDPCICSIEKENWLNHNCQRRSLPCACVWAKNMIFLRYFSTNFRLVLIIFLGFLIYFILFCRFWIKVKNGFKWRKKQEKNGRIFKGWRTGPKAIKNRSRRRKIINKNQTGSAGPAHLR